MLPSAEITVPLGTNGVRYLGASNRYRSRPRTRGERATPLPRCGAHSSESGHRYHRGRPVTARQEAADRTPSRVTRRAADAGDRSGSAVLLLGRRSLRLSVALPELPQELRQSPADPCRSEQDEYHERHCCRTGKTRKRRCGQGYVQHDQPNGGYPDRDGQSGLGSQQVGDRRVRIGPTEPRVAARRVSASASRSGPVEEHIVGPSPSAAGWVRCGRRRLRFLASAGELWVGCGVSRWG